jgi:methylmalonyl-CoA/ethylmalonyl-CoA epimerase
MLTKIDHIGIAVRSIDEKIPLYRDTLGLEYLGDEEVPSQHVRVAFFQIGESMIELLEPTSDESPIARFLEKNGEGIHHLAAGTDDIDAARERAAAGELRLLSDRPLDGAHGKLISFVHPRDTGGVLLEFTQRKSE